MPELPEVETVVQVLQEIASKKAINKVDVLNANTIEGDVKEFAQALKDATITSFSRVGKYIIFHFDNAYVMTSHLRMEGKYFLREETEPFVKHDMVIFHFKDGTYLAYNDVRHFGKMKLLDKANYRNLDPLDHVGLDPFESSGPEHLIKAMKNKDIAIKTALLDQSIMSGLGNIYVDEVCFATHTHPKALASSLSKAKIVEIFEASRQVLSDAIKAGGSTIKSYHPREGVSGNFQVSLKAYGKQGQPCPNCGTPLRRIIVGGRGTTYCPHCQSDATAPFVLGITGAIGSGKSLVLSHLKECGFITYSSDEIVHKLYASKTGQDIVRRIYSDVKIVKGEIDRTSLRDYLLDNPLKKTQLEKIVHKKVRDAFEKIVRNAKPKQKIALEVPLLFESGIDELCDATLLLKAPIGVREKRIQKRDGEAKKGLALNASFSSENEKKTDYVVSNNSTTASLYKKIDEAISDMQRHR